MLLHDDPASELPSAIQLVTFNIRSFSSGQYFLSDLLEHSDIVAIQEHWLLEHDLHKLNSLSQKHLVHAKSNSNDVSPLLHRRGAGGVALYYPKKWEQHVSKVFTASDRIAGIQVHNGPDRPDIVFFSVYMPTGNNSDANIMYQSTLNELEHTMGNFPENTLHVLLGDFNADLSQAMSWQKPVRLLSNFSPLTT